MKTPRQWYTFSSPKDYIKSCSLRDPVTECWNWQRAKIQSGYGQANWNGKKMLAHRLSYQAFNGELKTRRCICHKCDNPSCVNPWHLFQGTYTDNFMDAVQKQRHRGGFPEHAVRKNRRCKITDEQVREIRESTDKLEVLAIKYNTSATNISLIRRGKRKKLVDNAPITQAFDRRIIPV